MRLTRSTAFKGICQLTNLAPQKYKFDGIGKFSAVIVLRVLDKQPWGVWFTVGLPGKITFFILKKIFAYFASYGVVIANITIESVNEAIEKGHFDDALSDEVFKQINQGITPEQGEAIDNKVIDAFNKFATFGKL